jgi:hypothetical protein
MSGTYSNSGKSAWPDKPMDVDELKKVMQEASEKMADLNIPDCFLMTTSDYLKLKKQIETHGVEVETIKLSDSIMFGIPFEYYPSPVEVNDRAEELRRKGKKITILSSVYPESILPFGREGEENGT